jgi:hypothetical protein
MMGCIPMTSSSSEVLEEFAIPWDTNGSSLTSTIKILYGQTLTKLTPQTKI